MRLQKYMALCGVASRRASEELIKNGQVQVNGKVVLEMGTVIDPDKDRVSVDGKTVKPEKRKVYIMLNKPVGIVTSLKDEKGRTVVTDLIEGVDERIYPVGRLDSDTSGLLLLTNDGELAFKLTHPSKRIFKKYIAIVEGLPNKGELERLRNGIKIDGRVTSKAKVKVLKNFGEDSILEIEIFEGRNRQVKKMCEAVNHPVKKLKRVAFGELQLGGLESGNWRYLNDEELAFIRSL
ncbi:pseudouridine synthase [Gudongella oleilytica]|uniref:pseudouridine synthase n=1 Tax=Gudongella oleilytica TaxID=1582259 RepID=UPI0023EA5BA7|nr:pseudouridine synthase [Gudongella oleilytica]MDY0255760.1 pseudouridine synthase [Gudongella oleilytica]